MDKRWAEAAREGNIPELYNLIQEDTDVLENIDRKAFVDTPLHIAALQGHIEFAMEVMNLKPSFSKKLNKDGLSPMHLAVQNDHMLVVMWLIDVDRNLVRVKGKGGFTPLHYAAEKGNLNILREFYRGCPESIKDVTFQGDTVFHIAVKNHQKDAFELLLMKWLRWSSFEDAHFWERELLNWKNKGGETVLHIAASENGWNNQRQVLKMLLRCRARTDIEDLAGLTAMEILRDQVRLTERQIWNMQAAGAGFLFPLILFYKRVISLAHSVRQEAQTPRSRPLEWKLWRRRKWKSSEKRNIELVVDTLVATAVFQASLSPPGGLWQGTANADINSPMRVNNSSTTSAATSTHFTGTSVMSRTDFHIFFFANLVLLAVTACRMTAHLMHDDGGPSFSLLSVNWVIFSYLFSLTIITPNKEKMDSSIFRITLYIFAVYSLIALFAVYFVKYISVPSEPRVKPRRRRVKIRDRKDWW
ncbi:hypothetical protein P3X46_034112 [Hevea brasiliensis]|uniref:PGG domain-containing protein n=1 Tax=Hevea brasiliensis TaxID=3981 RepID=A0ABQ9KAC0_HEVBR|nr:ankyrin repeat-containing protein BDA1-like [Hevea brasiliensis]KAJ9129121.1 hypothetical protein P3X46_034112 [Hevea brasiliensis]